MFLYWIYVFIFIVLPLYGVKILSHQSMQLDRQRRRSGSLAVAVSDFALISARLA